jgi:hypothetical protein
MPDSTPTPTATRQGNSAAAHWCNTHLPPGPLRGRCVSEAARGVGPSRDFE